MINTSLGTTPAHLTTVKRMMVILILAFVGSQLNWAGDFFGGIAISMLNPNNLPTGLFYLFSYDPEAGIELAMIVFLLIWADFLILSLYPEHGWRQITAGFLGALAWAIGRIVIKFFLPYDLMFSLQV